MWALTDVRARIFAVGALLSMQVRGMVAERRRCINANHNHDYNGDDACLLLGVLGIRICRLVVWRFLLEA